MLVSAAGLVLLVAAGAFVATETAVRDGNNVFTHFDVFRSVMADDYHAVGHALRRKPGDVHRVNDMQQTPLHFAVVYARQEVLDHLMRHGARLDAQDKTGMTPLHVAAMYDRLGAARWLLEHGARTDVADIYGDTPLHTAAVFGNARLYALLLERGADALALNNEGRTPRQLAEYYGQAELLASLGAPASAPAQ